MTDNNTNYLSGGYRIFEITNNDDFEWIEISQGHETFEPYFQIPGTESEDLVRTIAKVVDEEVGDLKEIKVSFRGRQLNLHCHITFVADGKLIELCCGSGGAVCTSCTRTKADHTNFENIRRGLPMDRTNEFLRETFEKLKRTKKGKIATKTGKLQNIKQFGKNNNKFEFNNYI